MDESPMSGAGAMPAPGARIGQYELIRELGRGGMGAVYLARDTKLGRRVAIKFLHTSNSELTARFILEARATARCSHDNIVVIYEVGEQGEHPFMVLEYLQGAPLSKLLSQGRRLPPGRVVELIVPVVRALERAHEHNIVHRDLKPDNIFVTDSGTVKVLDFGVAKLMQQPARTSMSRLDRSGGRAGTHDPGPLDQPDEPDEPDDDIGETGDVLSQPGSRDLTRRGAMVGTLPYMSPEQWHGGDIDHRTDLWAVGILLFRMVAGRHPLAPMVGRQLMVTGVMSEPMPSARQACPDIPVELAAVIDRCLVKPRERRVGSARELLRMLEPLLPGRHTQTLRIDESPYAGLSAFQEADAKRFFGRTREIAAVAARLQKQPIMAVVGPSGVGKSSFVRAGIVPALKQSGEAWSCVVARPGRDPIMALAQLIAPLAGELTNTISPTGNQTGSTAAGELDALEAVRRRLYVEPGYLGTVLRSRARHSDHRLLLFVDQLEELYTLIPDVRERLAFTACLGSVADDATSPLRVIVSIRADFLDRVAEDERFMSELSHGLYFLAPPNRAGLSDALLQPAAMAGFSFENAAMVEEMVSYLEHTPGALPLLQFAATRLWDLRDSEHRMLTLASYQEIGGIAGALASHADAVLGELGPAGQALARIVFLRLVTPERTRAIVSTDELSELAAHSRDPGEIRRLIEHLVHARLLTVQGGDTGGAASVELVHESLIQSWPLLRRWLDDNQDDALFLDELRNAARQWHMRGRPAGLLWRGEAMAEARRWHRRYRGELPDVQRAYLAAVFALSARASRRKRMAIAGVIVLLSGLVAAAAVALVLIRDAEQEATAEAIKATRQLEETSRAKAEAVRAEGAAQAERQRAEKAKDEAERGKQELAASNAGLAAAVRAAEDAKREAVEARERADNEKRRARRDRKNAIEKEQEARVAEARAKKASEDLQARLDEEKERYDKLTQGGATEIFLDVQPASRRP